MHGFSDHCAAMKSSRTQERSSEDGTSSMPPPTKSL